jgi:hypothetical protein
MTIYVPYKDYMTPMYIPTVPVVEQSATIIIRLIQNNTVPPKYAINANEVITALKGIFVSD